MPPAALKPTGRQKDGLQHRSQPPPAWPRRRSCPWWSSGSRRPASMASGSLRHAGLVRIGPGLQDHLELLAAPGAAFASAPSAATSASPAQERLVGQDEVDLVGAVAERLAAYRRGRARVLAAPRGSSPRSRRTGGVGSSARALADELRPEADRRDVAGRRARLAQRALIGWSASCSVRPGRPISGRTRRATAAVRSSSRSSTKRSSRGPSRSAPSAATRRVCSCESSSPPMPSARLVTTERPRRAARRGGRRSPRARWTCRRGRRRACGTRGSRRASRSSGPRRRGRRRRAAACRARRRRRAGAPAARGRRRRAGSGSADRPPRRSADERVEAEQVDVVGDAHEAARAGLRAQRAGRVGEHEQLGAERLQGAHRRRDRARFDPLVDVRAAGKSATGCPARRPRTSVPAWPASPPARKPGSSP